MTSQLDVPVAPDGAHAGDLVGHDKWGRPMFLPGGGARDGQIVAGPDDDDADPDDEPDDDEPDEPAAAAGATGKKGTKLSYQQLLEQNAALSAQLDPETRRRMNAENRRLRGVRQFAEKHKIENLDTWLEGLGVDPTTGKPKTPAEPVGATAEPDGEPDDAPAEPDGDFDRRVELEVEKRLAEAEDGSREDLLMQVIQTTSVESELTKAGFSGRIEKALRIMDLDTITVDDDGTVIGVEEAVASLKEEIPEWFRRQLGGRVAPKETGGETVDGGGKPAQGKKPPTWEQRAVEGLIGRRG